MKCRGKDRKQTGNAGLQLGGALTFNIRLPQGDNNAGWRLRRSTIYPASLILSTTKVRIDENRRGGEEE